MMDTTNFLCHLKPQTCIWPFAGCGSDEFTCNNGECVEESDHCDGFDDCTDDSDEDGCGMHSLTRYMYIHVQCIYSAYIQCSPLL